MCPSRLTPTTRWRTITSQAESIQCFSLMAPCRRQGNSTRGMACLIETASDGRFVVRTSAGRTTAMHRRVCIQPNATCKTIYNLHMPMFNIPVRWACFCDTSLLDGCWIHVNHSDAQHKCTYGTTNYAECCHASCMMRARAHPSAAAYGGCCNASGARRQIVVCPVQRTTFRRYMDNGHERATDTILPAQHTSIHATIRCSALGASV